MYLIERARIFKRLWSPGIDSKERIPPAYVAWRAGTITLFLLGPNPHRLFKNSSSDYFWTEEESIRWGGWAHYAEKSTEQKTIQIGPIVLVHLCVAQLIFGCKPFFPYYKI